MVPLGLQEGTRCADVASGALRPVCGSSTFLPPTRQGAAQATSHLEPRSRARLGHWTEGVVAADGGPYVDQTSSCTRTAPTTPSRVSADARACTENQQGANSGATLGVGSLERGFKFWTFLSGFPQAATTFNSDDK